MKRYLLYIIGLLWGVVQADAQHFERERVYLQTDKQLYIAGELLWMKLYTTNEQGKLMSLSKIGYVELLSDSIPELQVKLDIPNGTGCGWMELPPMLSTGYYRLVAYTRNMLNEGDSVFFEKTIAVINPYLENEVAGYDPNEVKTFSLPVHKTVNNQVGTDKTKYGTRTKGQILLTDLPVDDLSMAVSVAGVDPLFEPKSQLQEWQSKLPGIMDVAICNDFIPEYEGAIIEGELINLSTEKMEGNKLVSALLSFPGKDIQLFGGRIDSNGRVSFITHQTAGKKEVVTTTYTPYQHSYRIDILSPFTSHPKGELPVLKIDSTWHDYLEERSLAAQVVEAYTADSLSRVRPMPVYFNYTPHREYKLDEYTRFGRMDEIFIEFITCARIRRDGDKKVFNTLNEQLNGYTIGKTLVLLDNVPVFDHDLMASYNPLLVNKVSVYLGRYLFGGQFYEGIISFSTYNYNYPSITFGASTQMFDYEGTQAYRYFYSPVYEKKNHSRIPDFRHTQLWEPVVETKGEKELTIPFYTSDIPGHYRVTVEGIGRNGSVVSASCIFEVTAPE